MPHAIDARDPLAGWHPEAYATRRHARRFAGAPWAEVTGHAAAPRGTLAAADMAAAGFVSERIHAPWAGLERVALRLVMTPDALEHGARFAVVLPLRYRCDACGGWCETCPACDGEGEVVTDVEVAVVVPGGARDGDNASFALGALGLPGRRMDVRVFAR